MRRDTRKRRTKRRLEKIRNNGGGIVPPSASGHTVNLNSVQFVADDETVKLAKLAKLEREVKQEQLANRMFLGLLDNSGKRAKKVKFKKSAPRRERKHVVESIVSTAILNFDADSIGEGK